MRHVAALATREAPGERSRGRGEIGKHAGFRCRCSKELGGSSPSARIVLGSDEGIEKRDAAALCDRDVLCARPGPSNPELVAGCAEQALDVGRKIREEVANVGVLTWPLLEGY